MSARVRRDIVKWIIRLDLEAERPQRGLACNPRWRHRAPIGSRHPAHGDQVRAHVQAPGLATGL